MKKGMAKQKRLWVGILAVALTALLLVTACAPPTTPPPTEKVAEIGVLACLTGGGATAEQPCFRGFLDYVRYFNEEKGIPEVTVEAVWRDTGTEVVNAMSNYRALADRGVPVILVNDSRPAVALKSQLEKDQIVFFTGGATGPLVYPLGWIFPAWATQGEALTAVLDYFMSNWEEEKPPKLQFFVADYPYGREPVEESTKYAEGIGFEVLPIELSPLVILDAIPQMLRIRERGADLVYIQHVLTGAGPAMRDAERLGLVGEMQFAGTEWLLGEALIDMVPVGVEGFISPKALPCFDETEIPGVKTIIDRQLEYHGTVNRAPEYMAGWVYGAILCESLERAVEEVGFDNLDGAAVKRALESFRDFDVDGIAKFTYEPERRRGCRDYALYQVQGGKIVRITDYHEVPILVPPEL